MPKKTQMSGFLLYMIEFRKREEKRGRKFPNGLKDVQADQKCSEEWTALSAAEKKEYNQRAKVEKRDNKEKLTTLGESMSEVKQRAIRQREYEENMKTYIENSVKSAENHDMLDSLTFCFIHVNHYYTKVELDATVDYIPAEFALIEFSLGEGIKRTYHQIIRTDIEMGYTRECYEHRDASHKIQNDLKDPDAEKDYFKIYKKFTDFLKGENNQMKLPPIYTSENLRTIVPCLFNRMMQAANNKLGEAEEPIFTLYSLEYLFGTLMYYTDEKFPRVGNRAVIAHNELSKEAFIYTPDIECFYHKYIEGTNRYCSQAIVYNWAYTMCDYCCPLLKITMAEGSQCPANSHYNTDDIESAMNGLSFNDKKNLPYPDIKLPDKVNRNKANRSHQEEMARRNVDTPLLIIDYSQLPAKSSASDSIDPPPSVRRPGSVLKNMSSLLKNSNGPANLDEFNFPALGRGRHLTDRLTRPGEGAGSLGKWGNK